MSNSFMSSAMSRKVSMGISSRNTFDILGGLHERAKTNARGLIDVQRATAVLANEA